MATRPIKIAIVGDDSNLKKTLKGASRKLEGFGKSITGLGFTAGAAFAGVATAAATKGVMAFAEFEKGMSEVMTLLPDAGEEVFGDLSDQVKDFSKEFGVLPDKAIPALYSALSAGVPKDNVFEFLEVAQKAAKGGVTELETAVDGISSVVNAYGAEVIGATEASDLMFTAVRLGKTTFEEISGSIFQMAPIASAVGIPFENLTASIALLTAQGTPTSVAATQMKAAMAELAKEGSTADVAFRDLAGVGLQQFLEGGGSFDEAVIMMKEGAEEAGISVLDMFGSIEAGQGILALTADGGTAFKATLDEMSTSAGATQGAFETMDTGLMAALDKIKANLEVLAIDIAEKVAPVVAKVGEFILKAFEDLKVIIPKVRDVVLEWASIIRRRVTPYVERFSEILSKVVDWVRTFIKENPHSALAALGVVVASVVVPAVLGLVAAFAALFSPVVIIVAALAALAAGVVYAYEHFETFRNIVDTVRDWLVNTLWPAMKEVAEGIKDAFWVVVRFFQNDFVPIVKGVVETMTTIWTTLADFFTTYVQPIISAALGVIMDVVGHLWDAIHGAYVLIKGLFTGDMAAVWDGLKEMVGGVVLALVGYFIELPMKILNASKPLVGKFALIVSDFSVYLLGKILDLIKQIPGKIVEFMAAVGADMLQLGKDVGGWLLDGFLDVITGAASAVADAFKSLIPDWVPGWLNPFDGGGSSKKTNRRTSSIELMSNAATTAAAAIAPPTGLLGGIASQLDLSPGSLDWFQNAETIMAFRQKGKMEEFNQFKAMGDLSGMEAFVQGGFQTPTTNIAVTVNAGLGTDGNQVGDQIVTALTQWERANGSIPITVEAI